MKSLLVALGFLTAIPVRTGAPAPGDLGRSGMCFPLVGLALGVVLVAAQYALVELFPPLLTATLVVALWAAFTGGLHLDGLADCADGLLATAMRERRLEILRDPRVGAFGVVALTLFLLLKVHAVAALLSLDGASSWNSGGWLRGGWLAEFHHVAPLVTSSVLARWVILIVAREPSHAGHLCLLRLKEDDFAYPETTQFDWTYSGQSGKFQGKKTTVIGE